MSATSVTKIKELLATREPPELGATPRAGGQAQAALNAALDSVFGDAGLPPERQELVRALIFLWHDHLDASHTISQGIENADGSLVHAIMHRREPDYLNSKYWWRRVGNHPAFPGIARRVSELSHNVGAGEGDSVTRLLPQGKWDPCAFVAACEAAEKLSVSSERVRLLRAVQRIESEVVLDYLLAP